MDNNLTILQDFFDEHHVLTSKIAMHLCSCTFYDAEQFLKMIDAEFSIYVQGSSTGSILVETPTDTLYGISILSPALSIVLDFEKAYFMENSGSFTKILKLSDIAPLDPKKLQIEPENKTSAPMKPETKAPEPEIKKVEPKKVEAPVIKEPTPPPPKPKPKAKPVNDDIEELFDIVDIKEEPEIKPAKPVKVTPKTVAKEPQPKKTAKKQNIDLANFFAKK